MSRSDRYILSQLLAVFGFFALVLVSIYWINRAVGLFDRLIADGQSVWVFLEFTALTLPNVIWLVLPVAGFVAAVFVANRMTGESELVVLQATGFSPMRLARPVVIFGLVVTVLLSTLGHFLVPMSRARLALRNDQIAENVTARLLSAGRFVHPAAGLTVYIRDITPAGEFLDLLLSDSRDPARQTLYTAERALLVRGADGPKLVMFDGMAQNLSMPGQRLATTRFADFAYDIGALLPGRDSRSSALSERTTPALMATARAADTPPETARAIATEISNRLSQTLLAPVAALIGFAALLLGSFSRFGLWRQIALAVVLLIAVKMIDNAGESLMRQGGPLLAGYAGALAGLGAALALLALAGRRRRPGPAQPDGGPA